MKPILYYGNDISRFTPCDAEYTVEEVSVKLHPKTLAISNKRKRARFVKLCHRKGITYFTRPVWKIYPPKD